MDIRIEKLKNGLRLVEANMDSSFSATVMVLVKTGSRFESEEESGIAHFVEHMMFKGTQKRPSSKMIGMDIETIGGSSNAFTSYDYTGYYIKVPSEKIENAFEIMADMVKNGLFKPEEIEKEKGVIIEEIRMYEDRPMSKVDSQWFKKFFGNSPLGRDIAGSIETVRGTNQEDFFRFRDKYYQGKNMVVVLAGNLSTINPMQLTEEYFGDIVSGDESKCTEYQVVGFDKAVEHMTKDIEQSHLMLGCYGHKRGYEDKYKFKVADAILSEGFGSKLFQVIRDELGLAYYVYGSLSSFEDVGVYRVGLGVENSKIGLAVHAVVEELRKVMRGDFSNEDLIRAKNYLIGNLVTDLENSDDMGVWYGIQELLLDKVVSVEEVKSRIENVSKDDVVDVSNKIFSGQNLLLSAVTPKIEIPSNIVDDLYL